MRTSLSIRAATSLDIGRVGAYAIVPELSASFDASLYCKLGQVRIARLVLRMRPTRTRELSQARAAAVAVTSQPFPQRQIGAASMTFPDVHRLQLHIGLAAVCRRINRVQDRQPSIFPN